MRVLVDSSVLLDVMTRDSRWAAWSEEKLAWHAERDLLAINPIIYAEVSVHFASIEELDDALSPTEFLRLPLPYEAGFLAAKCFFQYRRRGGREGPLCRTFTSAPTPPQKAWHSLRVTFPAIVPT